MKKKCTSCRKLAPVFKEIRHEHDVTNRHRAARKPVVWCEPCWKAYAEFQAKNYPQGRAS
jgi:hypothetical protein